MLSKKTINQLIKYTVTGIFTLIVNLFFLYFFTEILNLFYLVSAILAFLIAMTFSFRLNGKWTFPSFESKKGKYQKFLITNTLILFWDLFFLFVLVELIHIEYLISQTIAFSFSGTINFFIQKNSIFIN